MSTTTTPRQAPAGSSSAPAAPAAPASFAPASALRRSRWSAVQDSAYVAAGVSARDSVEAEWVYKDKAGDEVFRLLGLVTPDGRRRTRAAHVVPEGWEAGEGEGPLPLYRLDQLPAKGVVFVLGSEMDADVAGVAMDLPAVTSAFGPGLARRSDWSPLAGRCVAVVPDNDERGRAYAREVAALLLALEPRPKVKIVELPGLPAGGGVSQFDEELYRQSKKLPAEVGAEIRALADRAPLYRPPAIPGPQPMAVGAPPQAGEPVLTELAQVTAQDVQWLWPGRIPLGKLTLLFGDPGVGKSLLTLDLAARVTVGAAWPDGSGNAPQGSVLLATAEDALGDTVRGRLGRAGADPARVAALEAIRQPVDPGAAVGSGAGAAAGTGGAAGEAVQRPFTLADWRELEKAIEQRPEVRLVVIDPLSAYLGGCGGSSDPALRERLTPLAKLAERRRVALVLVTHLSKDPAGRALQRASGSLAFTAAARSAWLLTADPKDPQRRLLLPAKNNLAPDRGGLAFRVADGAVAWEAEPVQATADAALAAERRQRRRKPGPSAAARRATEAWLRVRLAGGPAPVGDREDPAPGTLLAEAKAAKLSPRTLRRAAEAVGVVKLRCPQTDRSLWQLPAPPQPVGPQPAEPVTAGQSGGSEGRSP